MVFGSCCLQQKINSLKYLKTSLACNLGRFKKKLLLQLCTYVSLCSHSSSSRCSYHISSPSLLNYSGYHLLQCPLLGLVLLQATEEETREGRTKRPITFYITKYCIMCLMMSSTDERTNSGNIYSDLDTYFSYNLVVCTFISFKLQSF